MGRSRAQVSLSIAERAMLQQAQQAAEQRHAARLHESELAAQQVAENRRMTIKERLDSIKQFCKKG